MGSRYGGLKQVDPVGPSGEALLDYSVFDAIRGGFGKVVFCTDCAEHRPAFDRAASALLFDGAARVWCITLARAFRT